MKSIVEVLLNQLSRKQLADAGVIPWSPPVPVFGDLNSSYVATMGLNPSNREFEDIYGNELEGNVRRFETLNSLGLKSWKEAQGKHVQQILVSYRKYFATNPYDGWFKKLDFLISDTHASFYCGTASHLDLIPYATSKKWSSLTWTERKTLLVASGNTIARILSESPVRLLVLNGASVVSLFQSIAGIQLKRTGMPSWTLCSDSDRPVFGYAYRGTIEALDGVSLKRKMLVVGFNHNIQSSFGVKKEIIESLRRWIGDISEEIHECDLKIGRLRTT
jgi:hypothetical protein